jgi:hypothetical protein
MGAEEPASGPHCVFTVPASRVWQVEGPGTAGRVGHGPRRARRWRLVELACELVEPSFLQGHIAAPITTAGRVGDWRRRACFRQRLSRRRFAVRITTPSRCAALGSDSAGVALIATALPGEDRHRLECAGTGEVSPVLVSRLSRGWPDFRSLAPRRRTPVERGTPLTTWFAEGFARRLMPCERGSALFHRSAHTFASLKVEGADILQLFRRPPHHRPGIPLLVHAPDPATSRPFRAWPRKSLGVVTEW